MSGETGCSLCDKLETICPRCRRITTYKDYTPRQILDKYSPYFSNSIPTNLKRILLKDEDNELNRTIYPWSSSYFIHGPAGCGKTVLAGFMMLRSMKWSLIENNPTSTFQFIKVVDLLDVLRNGIDQHIDITPIGKPPYRIHLSDYISKNYCESSWLCLDDFGAEKTTDWMFSALYKILDHRHDEQYDIRGKQKLFTVITSNLSLDQLRDKLNDDRIVSRIAGMCDIIEMTGCDRRIRDK